MTSEWPPSRAGSSVRASTSATPVLTRMRRSNASHAGSGSGGGAAPLHGVAVGVPRVAVGAAELAADVRIDRPEAHVRRGRAVEHRPHREREEPGAALALVEHLPAGLRLRGGRQEVELPRRHPQRAHPQWRQLTQPEARTSGPAHSGQTRTAVGGNPAAPAGAGWGGRGDMGNASVLRYLFGTPIHKCRRARPSVKTAPRHPERSEGPCPHVPERGLVPEGWRRSLASLGMTFPQASQGHRSVEIGRPHSSIH